MRTIVRASDHMIRWRWDQSDPFGVTPPIENPSALGAYTYNPRFPGQVYDRESNLFQNWNRDYDPVVGRYVQSDPIGLQGGVNTYGYVGGDPVDRIDPLGLTQADINSAANAARAMTPGWSHPSSVSTWSQSGKGGKYSYGDKKIYIDAKYMECLNDGEAGALLGTILHETAHMNQSWWQFQIDKLRERVTRGNSSNAQDAADAILWKNDALLLKYLKNRRAGKGGCQCRK